MNVGHQIVSTALQGKGGLKPFIVAGMDESWLHSAEGRAVFKGDDRLAYQHLLDHYARHGTVNIDIFRKDHPADTYRLAKGMKVGEVLDQARQVVQRWLLLDALNAAEVMDDDLDSAVAILLDRAQRLRAGVLRADGKGGMELLNEPEFESFIDKFVGEGIPFGIKEIDRDYGGGQPGQLITLVGRQKSTKSTLMAWAAMAAWDADYEVMFYNVELDMDFMRQKLLSIGAHVSPTLMRRGPGADPKLKDQWAKERAKLEEFYADLDDKAEVPFRIAQKFSRFTVADVAEDIERYKKGPVAVYIDGFYFMEDKDGDSAAADHKAIEYIAGDLKALAMEKQVTIYVSTQAQEKQQGKKKQPGIEGRTIQGGTGLLKASDLVLGIDIDDETKHVYINQIHNRYGTVEPVRIGWDWDKMEMKVANTDYSEFDV